MTGRQFFWTALLAALVIPPESAHAAAGNTTLSPSAAKQDGNGTMLVVTESDNGRTLSLETGEVLLVRLTAVPGTGYGWELSEGPGPGLVLEDGPDIKPVTPEPESRPGSSASAEWRFRGASPGLQLLRFIYVRPWERASRPASELSLRVKVKRLSPRHD
jgi:inhibitor of cysteine peptidase